jgi:hypothetical protein
MISTAPAAGNHGFLRRDAQNPYSFVWDDGTRFFMWGQTYYELVRTARAAPVWQTALDNSRQYGMNKVRMLLYPWAAAETRYPDTQPFAGSNDAPDHDQLDILHWRTLDEIIRYLDTIGMVADLIVLTDADRAFGTPAQDDRYLRFVIARFAAFHHVIWSLANEWNYTKKSLSYFDALGEIVRSEDPWMADGPNLRPLSVHQQTRIDFQFFASRWPVHAIIQYGLRNASYTLGDEWGNAGIRHNLGQNMPVVNDEYGYIGAAPESTGRAYDRAQHRRVIWGIAVGGGYGSAGDDRLFPPSGIPIFSAVWHDAPEYGDIRRLVDFFTTRGIPYWKMSSQNSIVASGARVYALAWAGREYVIYAAAGGACSIDLEAGRYEVRRYDPRTGAETRLPDVSGGRAVSFVLPETDDWVLLLRRAAR